LWLSPSPSPSLILLLLGTSPGLASMSPWADRGASTTSLGTSDIVWITLTSTPVSGPGGHPAGRLRTKGVSVHIDETCFRDTAHGLPAWAVAASLWLFIPMPVGAFAASLAAIWGGRRRDLWRSVPSTDCVLHLQEIDRRSVLLWLLGEPIPIIIPIALSMH